MADIAETIARWRAEGERIALATVIRVDGSAPRDEGAKMLVSASGRIEGSVSGGCVEGAVADEARGVLASGIPTIVRYGINRNMMWDVGLSCGGAIDVFIEALDPARMPRFESGVVVCTIVRGPAGVGTRAHAAPENDRLALDGTLGSPELDGGALDAAYAAAEAKAARVQTIGDVEVFIDPQVPRSRLIIVGAVHIAVALCEYASRAGFAVVIVDPRERLNNAERFPAATRLIVGWPEDELPGFAIDEDAYVAVLTHDEKFDDPTLRHVLPRAARYVGAIGSKKTQALRRARLLDAGVTENALDRLHAPIGLDIGARSPEEIAVAILAEMIAAKHRRGGAPLKDRIVEHIHD